MLPTPFAEAVLDLIERIPPGRVMTYGDIAEYLGTGGPRTVGTVLSRYGGGVPWWRVIRADGSLLPGHEQKALAHYRAEGTPLNRAADRVDMGKARWFGPPGSVESRPIGKPRTRAAHPRRV